VTDLYLIGTAASLFLCWARDCHGEQLRQDRDRDWKTPYTAYPGDYNGDGITDLVLDR